MNLKEAMADFRTAPSLGRNASYCKGVSNRLTDLDRYISVRVQADGVSEADAIEGALGGAKARYAFWEAMFDFECALLNLAEAMPTSWGD